MPTCLSQTYTKTRHTRIAIRNTYNMCDILNIKYKVHVCWFYIALRQFFLNRVCNPIYLEVSGGRKVSEKKKQKSEQNKQTHTLCISLF